MKTAETYPAQLGQFARLVLLPAVPRLTWWMLGLAVLSCLSMALRWELWPHFPQASEWSMGLLFLSLSSLPWLGAYTAQQLAHRVRRWWWRGFWWLVAVGAYLGAVFLSLLLVGYLVVKLISQLR